MKINPHTNMDNHKNAAAHVRELIKRNGWALRCRKYTACGVNYIQVFTKKHNEYLPDHHVKAFLEAMISIGLRDPDNMEILTHWNDNGVQKVMQKCQWDFEYYQPKKPIE